MCKKSLRLPPHYETAKRVERIRDQLFGNTEDLNRGPAWVQTDWARFKLLTELMERYRDRDGGYTRIIRRGGSPGVHAGDRAPSPARPLGRCSNREEDNAEMAIIELVDRPGELRPARPPSARFVKALEDAKRAIRDANTRNYEALVAEGGRQAVVKP